jgi:YesN/AraC family two-component response regulator
VLEAANGREALAVAQEAGTDIDLVLTDMIMPEMGGQELAVRMEEALPGVRMMYMSGYSEADKLQRGIRELGEPFLQKPFTTENLVAGVRHALDRARR